jgi:hypothetical protein
MLPMFRAAAGTSLGPVPVPPGNIHCTMATYTNRDDRSTP